MPPIQNTPDDATLAANAPKLYAALLGLYEAGCHRGHGDHRETIEATRVAFDLLQTLAANITAEQKEESTAPLSLRYSVGGLAFSKRAESIEEAVAIFSDHRHDPFIGFGSSEMDSNPEVVQGGVVVAHFTYNGTVTYPSRGMKL